jgi:hypothetical protein
MKKVLVNDSHIRDWLVLLFQHPSGMPNCGCMLPVHADWASAPRRTSGASERSARAARARRRRSEEENEDEDDEDEKEDEDEDDGEEDERTREEAAGGGGGGGGMLIQVNQEVVGDVCGLRWFDLNGTN